MILVRLKKGIRYSIVLSAIIAVLFFVNTVFADGGKIIVAEDQECDMKVTDNSGWQDNEDREIKIDVNDVAPGRRITDFEYCLDSTGCDAANEWISVQTYDANNVVSSYAMGVGTDDMCFWIKVPSEDIRIRAVFADFEDMNISYSPYIPTASEEDDDYWDVYVDGVTDFSNYNSTFIPLVTKYRGGDIILPDQCTNNGCLLKVSLTNENYNSYNTRFLASSEEGDLVDVSQMFNHVDFEHMGIDTLTIYKVNDNDEFDYNGHLYVEEENGYKSFYLIVDKRFFENNRSAFTVGDNKNRILSRDYIGLDFSIDSQYFAEGATVGFLSFTEYNNYHTYTEIFYGTPKVQLIVDEIKPVNLADGGSSAGMGIIKNTYSKIVSLNPGVFPIDENNVLTISDFYQQDYTIPLSLRNGNVVVKDVELTLNRFAFSNLLVTDTNFNSCRREESNPDCIYLVTSYRGLYDTFYSTGESIKRDVFQISKQNGTDYCDRKNEYVLYEKNPDFNPWAVAVFYSGDMVVATKSFNLGELVKTEGYNSTAIPNSSVNGVLKDLSNQFITDYDSTAYEYFGRGLGYQLSMNDIEYFGIDDYYGGHFETTLLLATKDDLTNNNVTRIALFLTNGELKPDEKTFPKLTYGVGEGKIYEIDNRVFEEFGGGE